MLEGVWLGFSKKDLSNLSSYQSVSLFVYVSIFRMPWVVPPTSSHRQFSKAADHERFLGAVAQRRSSQLPGAVRCLTYLSHGQEEVDLGVDFFSIFILLLQNFPLHFQ